MLAALALHLAATSPSCRAMEVPATAVQRTRDAALAHSARGDTIRPDNVTHVLAHQGWRLVWAVPEQLDRGVFIFRREGGAWRYVEVWGGSAAPDEADDVAQWAVRLGLPAHLAQCFATAVTLEGR